MSAARSYRASPTSKTTPISKRERRSQIEITRIKDTIFELLEAEQPMTVRQLFYRMVSMGVIEKSENEYNQTVGRLLTNLRREGIVPYDWVADNTRWQRKPRTHRSLAAMLTESARFYRRDLWQDQNAYVEVWLEKDALAGVLYEETAAWDVPLMVTRGYASLSFLYTAAEAIAAQEKPCHIYYFGDHDPSGIHIPQKVEATLREMAPDAEIYFERVAVTPEQIIELGLPTRPTKKSDTRSRNFDGESVEVDAIPPATLRQLVSDCIEQHVDGSILARNQTIEEEERRTAALLPDFLGEITSRRARRKRS